MKVVHKFKLTKNTTSIVQHQNKWAQDFSLESPNWEKTMGANGANIHYNMSTQWSHKCGQKRSIPKKKNEDLKPTTRSKE